MNLCVCASKLPKVRGRAGGWAPGSAAGSQAVPCLLLEHVGLLTRLLTPTQSPASQLLGSAVCR